jgi:hypothetical protein
MHVLGISITELRRERWSAVLAWHREARRIGGAIGIPMIQPEPSDG